MISVAEQFSNLRDTLGSILGIFWLLRWIRTVIAKITGRPPPADATALTPSAFARFQGRPATLPDGTPLPPRPSKKPFLFFLLAAFGLPYVMGKFIRALARSQNEAAQRQQQGLLLGPDGRPLPPEQQPTAIDPNQLDFCRVLYDYTPEPAGQAPTPGLDITAKQGDFVAVLARTDPAGNLSDWWQCRTRDGRIGYLPGPFLEVVRRGGAPAKQLTAGSGPNSRTQTMSTVDSSGTAAAALDMQARGSQAVPGVGAPPTKVGGKVGDVSAESFQKGHFYP